MRRHPAARIMERLPHRIPDGAPGSAHGSLPGVAHDVLPISHRLLRHTYASLPGR